MDIPDLQQGAWRFYSRPSLPADLPAAKAEAFAQFRARYGVPPAHVLDDGRYLYAGPLPEKPQVAACPVVVADALPADTVLVGGANGSAAQVRLFA